MVRCCTIPDAVDLRGRCALETDQRVERLDSYPGELQRETQEDAAVAKKVEGKSLEHSIDQARLDSATVG